MTRPSALTIARRALSPGGEAAVPAGSTLLVAVSGGPDSTALLDVCARLAAELDLRIVAQGVDHGLREDAAAELALAASQAEALGVAFGRTRVSVAPGGNLQARARAARYGALAAAAHACGASHVATAHHADDRAETFLLRLLRGAGARGLAVLPPRAPWPSAAEPGLELLRPLLRARRSDLERHLDHGGLRFATDPSNVDTSFRRARVRKEVMPLLSALDERVVEHLNDLADELCASVSEADAPLALPRATRVALARLLREDAIEGRAPQVWLPGGLTVTRRASGVSGNPSGDGRRAPYCSGTTPAMGDGRNRSSLGGIQRSSLKGPRSS